MLQPPDGLAAAREQLLPATIVACEQLQAFAAEEVIRREKGLLVVRNPRRLADFVGAG